MGVDMAGNLREEAGGVGFCMGKCIGACDKKCPGKEHGGPCMTACGEACERKCEIAKAGDAAADEANERITTDNEDQSTAQDFESSKGIARGQDQPFPHNLGEQNMGEVASKMPPRGGRTMDMECVQQCMPRCRTRCDAKSKYVGVMLPIRQA